MNRAPWLDWIRFIAAFMVTVAHARCFNWVAWGQLPTSEKSLVAKLFYAVTRVGVEWVIIFFVLSGFLVGGGTLKRCLDRKFQLGLFAIDRVSRIWVPLIPALLFVVAVQFACGLPVSVTAFLGNLFCLQGIFCESLSHPLWSLSYEVWFYVIAGAIGVIMQYDSRKRSWGIVVLAFGLSAFLRLSPWLLACWLIGAACFFMSNELTKRRFVPVWILFVLAGCVMSQLTSETRSVDTLSITGYIPRREVAWIMESIGVGLFIATVVKVAPTSSWLVGLENMGPKLSSFSYTLYLTHVPTMELWEHFCPEKYSDLSATSFTFYALKIVSSLGVALLFYALFEAHTTKVRAWLRKIFVPDFGAKANQG